MNKNTINELSDKTLSNYEKKSSVSQAAAKRKGDSKKQEKRIAGRTAAGMRLSGFAPKKIASMKECLEKLSDEELFMVIEQFTSFIEDDDYVVENEISEICLVIEENLDEVASNALKDYVKAAKSDARRHFSTSQLHKNVGNTDMAKLHYAEYKKRAAGINRAMKKLGATNHTEWGKYNEENLNELSTDTVKRYLDTAKKDAKRHYVQSKLHKKFGNKKAGKAHFQLYNTRLDGIARAKKKLGEEVESINEISLQLLKRAASKAAGKGYPTVKQANKIYKNAKTREQRQEISAKIDKKREQAHRLSAEYTKRKGDKRYIKMANTKVED